MYTMSSTLIYLAMLHSQQASALEGDAAIAPGNHLLASQHSAPSWEQLSAALHEETRFMHQFPSVMSICGVCAHSSRLGVRPAKVPSWQALAPWNRLTATSLAK